MPQRKISRGPPELLNIIQKVSASCNTIEFDHVIQFGSDDIDTDGMYTVCLRGYRDGQKVKWDYIIKWNSEPKRRTLFRESYKREVFFYQNIVPRYLEVQRGFKIIEGLKIKFLNCCYASVEWDKEAIVFLNPLVQGFRFQDRLTAIDLNHVSLVMKNFAKLHALSFILEKYRPMEFEEIRKSCCIDIQYSDVKLVPRSMITCYNTSVSVVKDEYAKKQLQQIAPYILQILNKCVMPNRRKYLTICHGDCWNNNVLFKYQNKNPVDVIFVDFQMVRYASPVTDIAYYLYMSTDKEFLSAHYDRVVNLYYNTLSAILRQCDLDPNDIYPEHVFVQDLREYSVIGLIEALVSMKIITAIPEEALKMIEMKYNEYGEECFGNCNYYVERVNGVVDDFFTRNYSLDAVLSKSIV